MRGGLMVAVLWCLVVQACATTCPEIEAHRAAFDAKKREGEGADVRLTLPFGLFDEVLASQIAQRPPIRVALPLKELGLSWALSAVLEGVRLRPASNDRIGATLSIALRDEGRGGTPVMQLELDAEVTPTLVRGISPSLELALQPRDIGALRASTTQAADEALSDWLRTVLPRPARSLVRPAFVTALTAEALRLFETEVWPRAKDSILGAAPLFRTTVSLPALNVRELAARSRSDALVLTLTTAAPDATALAAADDPVTRRRAALRMSGGTVAWLANRGMGLGLIPSRFLATGETSPEGPYEIRLGWAPGPTPLKVHLWRTKGSCRRASIAASVSLALRGDTMMIHAREGRYVDVAGPPFASTLAWLDNTFGRAIATSLEVGSLLRFDVGPSTAQLRVVRAHLEGDLLLELELGVARGR